MRKVLAATLMWAATATGLSAQAPATDVNLRVARAQPGKWEVPDCGLNKGNFLIGSGATYLKSGVEASDEVKKNKLFGDAERVLLEGIQKGQAGASGAWYYLGRAYLQTGDLIGADTALTRAQDLTPALHQGHPAAAPQHLDRPGQRRHRVHEGQEQRFGRRCCSSQADMIYRGEPNAYTNLGVLYNTTGQPDSAIVYFRKAVEVAGTDPKSVETRDQSQYNLAALLSNQGKWPEAVAAWQQYLKWKPDDMDAKKGYARALRGNGQPDAAAVIERELISGSAADVSTNDLMIAGVNFFRDKNYTEAAATFGRVVEREPWNRDALFNMANSYLGSQNGPELVKAGLALHAIDPMNESSVKLLAQGYQLEKNQPMIIKTYTELEALPFSLTIDQLVLQSGGAQGDGHGDRARGADHRDQADRAASGDAGVRVPEPGHGGGGLQRADRAGAGRGRDVGGRGRRPRRRYRRLAVPREVAKPIDTPRVPGRVLMGRGRNSVGRMPASQAGRRRFEPGRPL